MVVNWLKDLCIYPVIILMLICTSTLLNVLHNVFRTGGPSFGCLMWRPTQKPDSYTTVSPCLTPVMSLTQVRAQLSSFFIFIYIHNCSEVGSIKVWDVSPQRKHVAEERSGAEKDLTTYVSFNSDRHTTSAAVILWAVPEQTGVSDRWQPASLLFF